MSGMQLAMDPVMILMVAGAVSVLRPLFRGTVDGPRRVFALAMACAAAALAYRHQNLSAVRLEDAAALAAAAIGSVTLLDRVGRRGAAGATAPGLAGPLAALAVLAGSDAAADGAKPADGPETTPQPGSTAAPNDADKAG